MKNFLLTLCLSLLSGSLATGQLLLKPNRVFDGIEMHNNWVVLVEGEIITYAGVESGLRVPKGTQIRELSGMTLMPGLIEGHSHLLLHPYDETPWNDQVLKESPVERSLRGANHAKASLMAGVTTMRDLGSEGAGYADVYLRESIEKGIIPGPRLLVAGPAIVATGAYGPKGFHDGVSIPLGAEPSSGVDAVIETTRRQLGNGADFIKVYADYRWQPGAASQPTFLQEELKAMVAAANSAGSYVVAHASTPEGMRRAILAGVETIEHGDGGTLEVFRLMKEKGVVFYPTLAAGDAVEQYRGWKKGEDPDTERIIMKKASFKLALQSGVTIGFGGDVGVYTHGENYRELELMVAYGMAPLQVLRAATSVNARTFHLERLGEIKKGFMADLIAAQGDPSMDITRLRKVQLVFKAGKIVK
ncbi:metal-dependent hydrolase family protein [Lentiprolixibacter aurantiacus]|uniref:Amidohydrolase family protein n=1 Tax=Lentiprolixibacter aurantiacus TaxID=2993939 RepID=A0AAE3MN49_9FLAO|nr:amidohydrolase family protein [Lentiprolixibacter aurantiacus]MCX2720263.1 amidohydrolase family protein [Lentiprolixibacter aurantiacus]